MVNRLSFPGIKIINQSIKGPFIFYERERGGGLVGFGGGHSKKIGLKGKASLKKMTERGGGVGRKN